MNTSHVEFVTHTQAKRTKFATRQLALCHHNATCCHWVGVSFPIHLLVRTKYSVKHLLILLTHHNEQQVAFLDDGLTDRDVDVTVTLANA